LDAGHLNTVAPDKRKHSEALFDLLGKVFSEPGYYRARDMCRDGYVGHSHYDWQVSRIGLIGERVVTHCGVWGFQMRIGTAQVRVAGVGGVATDGDFRKRGLMDQTARAALGAMRGAGYDMTLLFGIDDFYQRFGYVRAWSPTSFWVRARDLPADAPTLPVSRFAPRPRPDLADLYNRCHAAVTGTAVRPTYPKRPNPWSQPGAGYLWRGSEGRPAGYVIVRGRGDRLVCIEYCGSADQALRTLAMVARRQHCQEVGFETIPYNSELARRLRRGTCRIETHCRRNGGPLIHLLNLPAAAEKLTGEWSRRLKASCLADWRGKLLLSGAREQVVLAIGDGKVTTAGAAKTAHRIAGGEALVQLLIGTDDPDEVIEASAMRVSGEARRLAQVLFPAQHPQLAEMDGF
jgi:predicted N-acetyltransferase YhbS